MAIFLGNEMADAMAKKAASEAALWGAAAEQVAWVDALAKQVQRRIIEANLQASKANPTVFDSAGERSPEGSVPNCPAGAFFFSNEEHTKWHFGDQDSGGNVKSVSRAWVKRLLCAG